MFQDSPSNTTITDKITGLVTETARVTSQAKGSTWRIEVKSLFFFSFLKKSLFWLLTFELKLVFI